MKQESSYNTKQLHEKQDYPQFFQMESSQHKAQNQPYSSTQELIFADYLVLRINILMFHIFTNSQSLSNKQRTFGQLKNIEEIIQKKKETTQNKSQQLLSSKQKLPRQDSQNKFGAQKNEEQGYDYWFKKCIQMHSQAQTIKQSILKRGNFQIVKDSIKNEHIKSSTVYLTNQKALLNEAKGSKNVKFDHTVRKYEPVNRKYSLITKKKYIQEYLANPTQESMKSIAYSLDISQKVFKIWLKKHRLNLKKAELIKAVQQFYKQKHSDNLCSFEDLSNGIFSKKQNQLLYNNPYIDEKITIDQFRDLARRVYNNKNFGAITKWCQQFIKKNNLERFCYIGVGDQHKKIKQQDRQI